MQRLCLCEKCCRHDGNGKLVARSTWYAHNPGGDGRRVEERQGHLGADHTRRNELTRESSLRDTLSDSDSDSSICMRKRSAEEDVDPLDRVKRLARSVSVCLRLNYNLICPLD